jgi:hypothetical protein
LIFLRVNDGSGILRRRYSGQHGLATGQERPVRSQNILLGMLLFEKLCYMKEVFFFNGTFQINENELLLFGKEP